MVWLALILILVGIGFFALGLIAGRDQEGATGSIIGGAAAAIVGVILFLVSCCETITAGHVGVMSLFGRVDQTSYLKEGFNVINPFKSVEEMSIQQHVYTMVSTQGEGKVAGDDSIISLSSDDLEVPIDASLAYRLAPSAAPWVYRNLGADYEDQLIRPAVRTGIREGASEFTAEEMRSEKRRETATTMTTSVEDEIEKIIAKYRESTDESNRPPQEIIIVSSVMLRKVGIPPRVKEAVERKLEADQDAQRMEFELTKAGKEKEKKIIEAEAIDEWNKKVVENLTPEVLSLRAIEATQSLAESPNAKIIMIGRQSDGLPIMLPATAK